ncbi:hypothetical protein MUK42_25526 [Musa troglodytarum]|nr:hypothetical protein MUK42_25526 [Musa troglodytarum]
MGAELHYTERGGDITFHGPRQAILYPIVSLRDIGFGARNYVEGLESVMIEVASFYGVNAHAGKTGETGVWVGDRKIGAIGVRISSGITSHGLAFNIDPDLSYFKHIVPCGIPDKGVTSLKTETQKELPPDEVIHEQLIHCFAKVLLNVKDCTQIIALKELQLSNIYNLTKFMKGDDNGTTDIYNVEAAEILVNEAQALPVTEAAPIYEQLLCTFPTAAKYWKQYVEAYMAINNDEVTKQIFSRCLLNCLQISLW